MNQIISVITVLMLSFSLLASGDAKATNFDYVGTITVCSGFCDSFASLEIGSSITGLMEIDTAAGGSFDDASIDPFQFSILSPGKPLSGPVGDPVTDNPLFFGSVPETAVSNGTAGTTDAGNEISGGQMLIEFLVPPLSSNGVYLVFDLATGSGQFCLFYQVAGCIPGATEVVKFEGQFVNIDALIGGDGTDDTDELCVPIKTANGALAIVCL